MSQAHISAPTPDLTYFPSTTSGPECKTVDRGVLNHNEYTDVETIWCSTH